MPIGDEDPEDAYDAADPNTERVAVLRRWVPSIEAEIGGPAGFNAERIRARIAGALDVIALLRRVKELPPDEYTALKQRLDDLDATYG